MAVLLHAFLNGVLHWLCGVGLVHPQTNMIIHATYLEWISKDCIKEGVLNKPYTAEQPKMKEETETSTGRSQDLQQPTVYLAGTDFSSRAILPPQSLPCWPRLYGHIWLLLWSATANLGTFRSNFTVAYEPWHTPCPTNKENSKSKFNC